MSVTFARLKELRGKRAKAVADAGVILTTAATANRDMSPEERTKFDSFHAEGDRLLTEITTVERQFDAERSLEAVREDPRQAGREDRQGNDGRQDTEEERAQVAKKRNEQYHKAYRDWIRGGFDDAPERRKILREGAATNTPEETRALSAITGTAGGYSVPQGMMVGFDVALKWYGNMMDVAEIIETSEGQIIPYPSFNDTGNVAEATNENTAVATNVDPTYGVINLSAYMRDSGIVKVPFQLLEDGAFDIEKFLNNALAERIGRKINTETTTGNGVSQAKGILTAATSSGITTASATSVAYPELVSLMHAVDKAYRNQPGTGWVMHDQTLSAIRQLTDSQNRPLFVAGGMTGDLSKAAPDTILGYPVNVNNDMPSIAATVKSVLFGALKKYKIRRVKQVNIIRFAERFADALQVGFLAYMRIDGNLVDSGNHPVQYITQHA